jgi:hypothetical protein
MKKILILFFVLPSLFFLHGCCTPDPIAASNAVTLHPQETNVWCWAAVTQMITEFLGHGRTRAIWPTNALANQTVAVAPANIKQQPVHRVGGRCSMNLILIILQIHMRCPGQQLQA